MLNNDSARMNASSSKLLTLLSLLYLLLAVGIANAQEQYFPELTGRVVDQAGLLSDASINALDAQLQAHEQETSNQLVVVTVSSLHGYEIADYANQLGRHWQIGSSEEDNGVLLVVAPNDRKVRIEVGYGLEGALTDALSSIIVQREILPAFRDKQYAAGIQKGVSAILQAIAGEYTAPSKMSRVNGADPTSEKLGSFLPLIFIAMIGVPEILRRSGRRKAANGAFPAGFGGLLATLISGNILIGLALAIAVFLFVYFKGSSGGGGGGGSSRTNRGGYAGTGGFGGSGGFGGGFSGGGGSFGGGGASGSW